MKHYPVHTVDVGGETLAYRKAGTGEKVVLLVHGNMSGSAHWQTAMEALEGAFTVYAPDLRGFGDSTYNARFDSLRELAEDLAKFADALGIGEFQAVGWSTGGGVVLEMAASLPGRVRKIVLMDAVPPTGYPIFKKDANGAPITTQLLETKEEIAADAVQVVPALTAFATGNRAIMKAIWDAVIYNLNQPPEADYEYYLDTIMKQRNLVDIDYALLKFNMTDQPTGSSPGSGRLALVQCPIVLLQGEKDMVVPFAWAQGALAAYGDRATMITFANSGHAPITDEPELFMQTLKEVLG